MARTGTRTPGWFSSMRVRVVAVIILLQLVSAVGSVVLLLGQATAVAAGYEVVGHDPQALTNARSALPDLDTDEDCTRACDRADVVLVMTDWPQYRDIDPACWGPDADGDRTVIDTRLCLDAPTWRDASWRYLTMAG